MGRIPDLRQLKQEDFDSKDQQLIGKLAFPFNNFMQQVVNLFKNGIDFNNLNQQVVTLTVSVDDEGYPVSEVKFKSTLLTKVIGLTCINAVNTNSTIRFPSAQPCLTFNQNNGIVSILNISGLPIPPGQTNSDTYQLTLIVYGANLNTSS